MIQTRPHPHLVVTQDDSVLHVTLDNPRRRGAQTPSLWLALAEVARVLTAETRVVVLRSEGPTFSAGLDRGMLAPEGLPGEPDLMADAGRDPQAVAERIAGYQEAFTLWRSAAPVVVAAVQGHAVGAGFQLALAADLRIAADDAQFVMAETSLGLVPDLGGTKTLVEAIGYARALEVCVTGRPIGAQEAQDWGLVNLVVPAADLGAATDDLVAALLAAPGPAAQATKLLLASATALTGREQLAAERSAQAVLLAGMAEGLRARRAAGGPGRPDGGAA